MTAIVDRTFVAERPTGVWRTEVEVRWALVYMTSDRTATLSDWSGYTDREQAVVARAAVDDQVGDPDVDLVLARWWHRIDSLDPIARSLPGELVTTVTP